MSRRTRKPRNAPRQRPARLRAIKLNAGLVRAGLLLALLAGATGCSAFPTEPGSRAAETTWLLLDAIDTAQTAQLVRHPKCFYEADPMARAIYGNRNPSATKVVAVNLLLMPLHARISRWIDDRAAQAYADDSDSVGLWYTGRFAWHALSLAWSGASVAHNYVDLGVTPLGARCDR